MTQKKVADYLVQTLRMRRDLDVHGTGAKALPDAVMLIEKGKIRAVGPRTDADTIKPTTHPGAGGSLECPRPRPRSDSTFATRKQRIVMPSAKDILEKFYAAVVKKDIAAARTYLNDDLLFLGLFETYRSADEYIAALTKLLQVVVRLNVKRIIAEGDDVAAFFELETKAPAAATTLVAEWHQIKNGRISQVESAFDGRPFTAMFVGGKR